MSVEALVFDLGGVLLVGRDGGARRKWEAALDLREGQLERIRVEAVGPGWQGGRSEAEIRSRLKAALGLTDPDLDRMLADLAGESCLDPLLVDFVGRARSRYRTAILANNGPQARAELNARFGIEQLVDQVVISAEEGIAKPDPAIYHLVAERLGVRPDQCLFVDDQPRNVAGAEAAGMTAIRHDEPASTRLALRRALGMIEHDYRAAGGVVVRDDQVLLLRRAARGEWRLPKGHVEAGETDVDAALREVTEESGYDDLEVTADLGVRHLDFDAFVDGGPGHHVARDEHYFLMAACSDRTRERDPAELKYEPVWVAADRAEHLLTYDFEREWVRTALR